MLASSDQDDDEEQEEAGKARRVRSTRHLPGFPDLPVLPVEDRTIGKAFTDEKTGRTYRPSMFLTITLPSYGKVIPGTGVPRNPKSYDYRRAALDALLFPRLVDRFWQNLRRAAGYKVQYFAAVEPQRRLAPHLHAAVRGAIPRATIKAVAKATYAAIWWPPIDQVLYDNDYLPGWHADLGGYLDPDTGAALRSWTRPSTSSTTRPSRCTSCASVPRSTSRACSAAPPTPTGPCGTCAST